MHLLIESYFSCFSISTFTILSKFKPLLISDSMDIITKLFRGAGWIDNLKYVLSSLSLENSFLRMPRSLVWSIVIDSLVLLERTPISSTATLPFFSSSARDEILVNE